MSRIAHVAEDAAAGGIGAVAWVVVKFVQLYQGCAALAKRVVRRRSK